MKTNAEENLLDVQGVTLQYRTAERIVTATHRVSFNIRPADRFVLLGASGCGKSSLLKAVGGYLEPSEGSISLRGAPRHRARAGPDDGVPGIRPAVAVEDRARQRGVPADRQPPAQPRREAEGAGTALYRQGRAEPFRRRLSAHAVRRHEAARGDRPRHGDGAGDSADGRTLRRTGRADAPHACRTSCCGCGRTRSSPCCS